MYYPKCRPCRECILKPNGNEGKAEKNISLFCGYLAVPGHYCDHGAGGDIYTVVEIPSQTGVPIKSQHLYTKEQIYSLLSEIPDPEIPVISIVELGVVRDAIVDGKNIEVKITPTYSGCPAMKQMEDDVRKKLSDAGFENIRINTIYQPAWTTDWLSAEAKEKLRLYGIAPPEESTSDKSFLTGKTRKITCPRCKSTDTVMVSQFGSTACKALYKCNNCLEAFDYFKCI
jgi:ring-1,2-phenylacetyl-CoA epoxidase subunit PaaD